MRKLEQCLRISLERWAEWMKLYLFDIKIGSKIFATSWVRILIVSIIQLEVLSLLLVFLCILPSLCKIFDLGPAGSDMYILITRLFDILFCFLIVGDQTWVLSYPLKLLAAQLYENTWLGLNCFIFICFPYDSIFVFS